MYFPVVWFFYFIFFSISIFWLIIMTRKEALIISFLITFSLSRPVSLCVYVYLWSSNSILFLDDLYDEPLISIPNKIQYINPIRKRRNSSRVNRKLYKCVTCSYVSNRKYNVERHARMKHFVLNWKHFMQFLYFFLFN